MSSKEQLAERLLKLSYEMLDVATELDYYGGFNPDWRRRSQDLSGAAYVCKLWSRYLIDQT